MKYLACVIAVLSMSLPTFTLAADPEVFKASGANPADILAEVNAFRNFLGTNNGVGGTFGTGRRETGRRGRHGRRRLCRRTHLGAVGTFAAAVGRGRSIRAAASMRIRA